MYQKHESIRTTIKCTFQKTGNRRSLDNYVRPDLDTYQIPKNGQENIIWWAQTVLHYKDRFLQKFPYRSQQSHINFPRKICQCCPAVNDSAFTVTRIKSTWWKLKCSTSNRNSLQIDIVVCPVVNFNKVPEITQWTSFIRMGISTDVCCSQTLFVLL